MSGGPDRQRYRRLKDHLGELLGLDASAQRAYLDEHCVDRPALRLELESLVEAGEQPDSIFDSSARPTISTGPAGAPPPPDPTVEVPGYRIEAEISSGGMGTVYRARRRQPDQEVALKVIKQGMGTREVLRRFDDERQALALMNHSNIAKIFDAGVTRDGLPYFVMEYVPGLPITRYCDERRLAVRERLRLFLDVCEGVSHAHRKTVMHRDLKPGNILVMTEGARAVPKIIDFGLAKALTPVLSDRTRPTAVTGWVGTPEYMSPEQASSPGEVDTRTDVYSLGVLLYRLLTGSLPIEIDRSHADGIPAQIRNAVVTRPSRKVQSVTGSESGAAIARARDTDLRTLRRALARDLDRVILKCLQTEPERRYTGVEALAQDIARHLRNEPVQAVPPEFGYRFQKFVLRHRRSLTAGLVVTALLGLGAFQAVVVVRQANRARQTEAELSRRQAAELVEEARLLAFDDADEARAKLALAASKAPGWFRPPLETARIDLMSRRMDEAREAADRLLDRYPNEGPVHAFWSAVYRDLRPDEARSAAERARELFAWQGLSRRRADALLAFDVAFVESDPGRAIEGLTRSIELYEWYFPAYWQRAVRLFRRGQERGATGDARGAREDLERSLADSRLMSRVRDRLAMSWIQLGAVELELAGAAIPDPASSGKGAPAEALVEPRERIEAAIASFDEALRLDPSSWRANFNRALAVEKLAKADASATGQEIDRSRLEEAVRDLDRAIDNATPDRQRPLWAARRRVLHVLTRYAEAVESATRAIELGDDWEMRRHRGDSRKGDADYDGAATDYAVALELTPASEDRDGIRAEILEARADTLFSLGRWDEALHDARAALELEPRSPLAGLVLARAAARTGDAATASRHFDASVDQAGSKRKLDFRLLRGVGLWQLGELDAALEDIEAYALSDASEARWVALWGWEIERLRGDPRAAKVWLDAASASDVPLLIRVTEAIRGHTPAGAISVPKSVNDRVVLFYSLGIHAFAERRHAAAARWFERCMALGRLNWVEHHLAQWHLERIDPGQV